jgi:thioredoxin-related protein
MKTISCVEDVDRIEGEALVLFSLPACEPCEDIKRQVLADPELDRRTHVLAFEVGVPWHKDLVRRFKVSTYPTVIFIRAGEVLFKLPGAPPTITVRDLAQTIFDIPTPA